MRLNTTQRASLAELIWLTTDLDVAVRVQQTWPFMSRGVAVLGEPPSIKLWAGWPYMDARLVAHHEAIHVLYPAESHNSRRFRDALRTVAINDGVPRWWFWLHVANLWLTARLGRRFLCLVMREDVRAE